MESITVGSKEDLIVDVTDTMGNYADLSVLTPKYDVKDKAGVMKMNNQNPIAIGMRLQCLIDTTAGGNWTPGHYFLYVRFTAAPEAPVLGPLEFKVNP